MKMSAKFTCRFCKELFDAPKGLYKHLQLAHNASSSRDNRTCPICGVLCSKYEGYRDHLLYIHGQTDDGQKLTFRSLNEFLLWKTELEIKHNCKYVLQSAPKVLPTKEKKYFYQCDRSDSKSKDRKDKKSVSVVMKTCSSVISVVEGTGIFKVEYWDTHSGHNDVSNVQSVQNELEAAISSVEMVNAIADSDDSFDRSAAYVMPDNSSSSISNVDKHTLHTKANSPSSINNFNNSSVTNTVQKTKGIHPLMKTEGTKKKTTNTSILYSLASVACGKGISKKSANKSKGNKITGAQSTVSTELQVNSRSISEPSDKSSENKSVKQKDVPTPQTSVSTVTPIAVESTVTSSVSSPLPVSTKAVSSGPLAIAPKISTVTSNTINSLFTTNSAFPNQLVIVNPVSLDQNSINSSQNVFTTGQNILFSLGPIGQNILPSNTTPQTISQVPILTEKSAVSGGNTGINKNDTSKINTPNILATSSVKNSLIGSQSASNSIITSAITSAASSTSPITLTTGINNAPVILSSLPVGSTFMSVNNNLIPIASPSGAFLPTGLPPNIVLTPVVPSTSTSKESSTKSTVSSASIVPTAPQNLQTQMRFTAPSTIAITVSSIVKEPVYTSSAIKHMSSIVTSSSSPVSSASAHKNSKLSKKAQNMFIPIAVAGSVSPHTNANRTVTYKVSNTQKNASNSAVSKPSVNPIANKVDSVSKTVPTVSTSKFVGNISTKVTSPVSNKSFAAVSPSVDVSPVSSPRSTPSARKRMGKSILQSKSNSNSVTFNTPITTNLAIAPTVATKVVNSQLNLAPISSTPNVTITSQQLNKPGTLLFESSGEIYMLEPVENEVVQNFSPLERVTSPEAKKIKIDRSMQTSETSTAAALKSKLQRKRAAPPTDDSAVMLKVKCYQLEMKYLSSQTECKRLKVELTRERIRNSELSGKKANINFEGELVNESSRSKALEIMKEIEDKYSGNKDVHIYTMTKTSVLRSLYEDLEELCVENGELYKELENYRAHDKFYKSLKKRLYDEDF